MRWKYFEDRGILAPRSQEYGTLESVLNKKKIDKKV
jgi:hypothetical protein